jgi:hypothetical protein
LEIGAAYDLGMGTTHAASLAPTRVRRSPFAARRRSARLAVACAAGAQVLVVALQHVHQLLEALGWDDRPGVGWLLARALLVGTAGLLATSLGAGLTTALRFYPRRRLGRTGALALCAAGVSAALLAWAYHPVVWF